MSERKVLNKYYPPDFDASKIPRVKREKNRQFVIRLMAPFNMRCTTCGEYIYRGKKFNARKEDVIGKLYLGIQIYRFYIKCTKCLAEITFLTDPENQDYLMENGAIRNFESIRLAEKQAEAAAKQEKEEEVNNPMKILENRTRDSRREMDVLETLEDLRELNAAHSSVDPKILLEEEEKRKNDLIAKQMQQEKEEDEEELQRILGKISKPKIKSDNIIIQDDIFSKKHKHSSDSDEEEVVEEYTKSKVPKIDPVENNGFVKPSLPKNNDSKLKLSLAIKKKETTAEPIPLNTNQNILQTKPVNGNALTSLLSTYDDSNSSGEENSD